MGLIGGGLILAAGAQVGAAALAKGPGSPGDPIVSAPGQDTTPSTAVLGFNNLLQLGVFDPSVLRDASPLNSFIRELSSSTRG